MGHWRDVKVRVEDGSAFAGGRAAVLVSADVTTGGDRAGLPLGTSWGSERPPATMPWNTNHPVLLGQPAPPFYANVAAAWRHLSAPIAGWRAVHLGKTPSPPRRTPMACGSRKVSLSVTYREARCFRGRMACRWAAN